MSFDVIGLEIAGWGADAFDAGCDSLGIGEYGDSYCLESDESFFDSVFDSSFGSHYEDSIELGDDEPETGDSGASQSGDAFQGNMEEGIGRPSTAFGEHGFGEAPWLSDAGDVVGIDGPIDGEDFAGSADFALENTHGALEVEDLFIGDSDVAVPGLHIESIAGDMPNPCEDGHLGLPQYDPAASNPDAVIGEPEKSMEVWENQGDTNRCALYSGKFAIEELTGQDVDIGALAQEATDAGIFTEEKGTYTAEIGRVLGLHGVETKSSQFNTVEDLERCLADGHVPIVTVDAPEMWYGDNDDWYSAFEGANHAVEFIGIDRTDPNNPMAILNDSAPLDGAGEMVPLDRFVDAWQDGKYEMIECSAA